ncbi:MAG TPA: hypothetical protein VF412_16240 [Bdellovibrio sp.]|uniref:hypothetical protein n=1 Tax=Bdellovibrio sp. TaxID=28201 RepID=UPI002F04B097
MEKFILRFLKLTIFATFAFSAVSCSPGTTDDITGLDPYLVNSGSFSQSDSNTLAGTGAVRFTNVLGGIYTNNSFALKASLDSTGNSVTVIMNSSNMAMTSSSGGVAITFTRSGANVVGSIAVNGNSAVTLNASNLSFYVPTALDVIIDVHNISSSRAHVLIWRRDATTVYTAANADIDTDVSSDYTGTYPASAGAGVYYGLNINGATVTAAQLGAAQVAE